MRGAAEERQNMMEVKQMIPIFSFPTSIELGTALLSMGSENMYSIPLHYMPNNSSQVYFICSANYNINQQ